jgi:glycosyltransferase involved in cell wall biosynthesis
LQPTMSSEAPLKVVVLDMQPIEPAVGGGRLRLLGLYHALGQGMATQYLGTYDWPGPGFSRKQLTPTLEEILVPLSARHFAAAAECSRSARDRVVIDATFPQLAHFSPDYVAAARDAARSADIVVFSHPWIFPLVRDLLDRDRQLVAYDAHNVEGLLRAELLDDGGPGTKIVRAVVQLEYDLCHFAHITIACSHEDRASFHRLYGISYDRMRVVPNGTFTERLTPATPEQKTAARQSLQLGPSPVAFFIGSNYAPNVEAGRYVANVLAPEMPHILFVVAGGVGEALSDIRKPFNVLLPGLVNEEQRRSWLHASDIAINPMFGGSGTNIKMLDYMAAGLPIVTTAIGARGLSGPHRAYAIAPKSEFVQALASTIKDAAAQADLAPNARRAAERFYSWERLSPLTGEMLRRAHRALSKKPFFSIVVPLPDSGDQMSSLKSELSHQTLQDFEVIPVLHGPGKAADVGARTFRLDLGERDEWQARDEGANWAVGTALAFVDPGCRLDTRWLEASRDILLRSDRAVAVESMVWRNQFGASEIDDSGNLIVRPEAFQRAGGFRDRDGADDFIWRVHAEGRVAHFGTPSAQPRPSFGADRNPAPPVRRIGVISSWQVPCGIAEYSKNLVDGLLAINLCNELVILCDDRTPSSFNTRNNLRVEPCWNIDNHQTKTLRHTIARDSFDAILLQHQPGLISWDALTKMLRDLGDHSRKFIVTTHNTTSIYDLPAKSRFDLIAEFSRTARILVHSAADLRRLEALGLRDNVQLFPHGCFPPRFLKSARRLEGNPDPLLSSFGFLFPHKGIYALLEAFGHVRRRWPRSRLRLVNAVFPRSDSRNEHARCRQLADARGLGDCVEWVTEFIPEHQAIALLSEADLLVMPYAKTGESASGALRVALASGVAIAATPISIFDEAREILAPLNNLEPIPFAEDLCALLLNAELRQELQDSAAEWTQRRSWSSMATALTGLICRKFPRSGDGSAKSSVEGAHDSSLRSGALSDRHLLGVP